MNKLAIVVPYYKIDYFEITLKSLSTQVDKRFTLYIGNDASPDDPKSIIDKYFQPSEYKYYKYEQNLGSTNLELQWARILENVSEEWFQILGDDDYISENFVENFYLNYSNLRNQHVVKFNNVLIDDQNKIIKSLYIDYKTGVYPVMDLLIEKIGGGRNNSLSEHVFRKESYQKVGFKSYPLAWHTDDMFVLEMSRFSTFFFVAESVVYIRTFDGSISGSKKNLASKKEASKLFLSEFSRLLITHQYFWSTKKNFLFRLRNYTQELGLPFIKQIYHQHGIAGKMYWVNYQLRLKIKKILPHFILSIFQKNDNLSK